MYLIVIAWIYVVLMMSVAEATNTNGTVLGAIMTFFLYGVGPVALVLYLMGAPFRIKAMKKREAAEVLQPTAVADAATPANNAAAPTESGAPNAGSHAAGGAEAVATDTGIAPVRKET